MKIRPVGAELFHGGGRIEFAKGPKKKATQQSYLTVQKVYSRSCRLVEHQNLEDDVTYKQPMRAIK
jgi:hypothetical protein